MLSPVNVLIGFLWFISALIDYADFCAIWQLKEYRRDRFRDFISTDQGRRYFFRFSLLYRFFGFFIAILWPINDASHLKNIFLSILILDILFAIFRFFVKRLKRPIFTSKALGIIFASLLFESFIFFLIRDWSLPFFLFLSRFFILTFFVGLFEFPTRMTKKIIIDRAIKKMKKFPNVKVIGITGSYGKSSVKEFTAHLLSQKYRVMKTPKNINSEIGIAKFILSTNFSDIDFFVVEMGAYKTGEIALICKMVHPSIGVLTAIAEQHLALFGSIKNIQSAKYELLRSIPSDGFIITNADNPYCMELLKTLNCQNIETFGTDDENTPTCLTTNIESTKTGTNFEGIYRGNRGKILTPVIGAHHAYNIAPAAILAIRFGLSKEQIEHGCATLPTDIHGSLHLFSYGKAQIIDDSYNSNPQGFKSALDVLSSFPSHKKRIVITRGMIELGERSNELHEKIGEEIAFTADELIVITKDFFDSLKRGVGQKYRTQILLKEKPSELLDYVRVLKEQDCVILLESRIPAQVYSEITEKKV